MNIRLVSRAALVACGTALLWSCGSKDSLGSVINPFLVLTPDSLNLSGAGTSEAGEIVATDNGFDGTVNVATTCSSGTNPVAQVSPLSGRTPLTVAVTPQNAGSCTVTFSDSNGLTRTSTVSVTSSGIGVTSRSRK